MPSVLNSARKGVFVHVPKTAGTALTHALDRAEGDPVPCDSPVWVRAHQLDGLPEAMTRNHLPMGRKVWAAEHARAVDLRAVIGPGPWKQHHSVALLRDPYDRMASTYHYIRGKPKNPQHGFCHRVGLAQYIVLNCLVMPQPQSDWVTDPAGNLIVSALYDMTELDRAAEELGQRFYGKALELQMENQSANLQRDKGHAFDGVPDWVMDLFHDTYAADFALTRTEMDSSRVRQTLTEPDLPENPWEVLATELMPRMLRQNKRDNFLARRLRALEGKRA